MYYMYFKAYFETSLFKTCKTSINHTNVQYRAYNAIIIVPIVLVWQMACVPAPPCFAHAKISLLSPINFSIFIFFIFFILKKYISLHTPSF